MHKSLLVISLIVFSIATLFAGDAGKKQQKAPAKQEGQSGKKAKSPAANTESTGASGVSFVTSSGDTVLKVQENGLVVADSIKADSLAVSGTVNAGFFVGDGSGLTNLPGGAADNLGNHTATQALNLNGNNIANADTVFSEVLEVDGEVKILSGSKNVVFSSRNFGNGNTTDLFFNKDGAGFNQSEFVLFNANDNQINERYFQLQYTEDTTGLSIAKGGNIGIGTIYPTADLQVVGTIAADTILADSLAVSGTVSAAAFIGDGSGLTGLPNTGWSLTGNSGTDTTVNFIGTTDNMPLDFKAFNIRGLRLHMVSGDGSGHPTINIIGGHEKNLVAGGVWAATISGGGINNFHNTVIGNSGTVSGGWGNVAGENAVISGGIKNTANGSGSFIGGGTSNTSSGEHSIVVGGNDNTADADGAFVGGGIDNTASGIGAMIPGGGGNSASGVASFAAGLRANANHNGAFVWADANFISETDSFYSMVPNEFAARATGGVRFVTGVDGSGNPIAGVKLAAGDSVWTTLNGNPIGGGAGWGLAGNSGTDTTVNFIGTTDDMGLDLRVNNRQALRLISNGTDSPNIIGGHENNAISLGFQGSIIAGGGHALLKNTISGNYSTISGGQKNNISAEKGTISGGEGNAVTGVGGTIGGGRTNAASETYAAIAGGVDNTASGIHAAVAGGRSNTASGRGAAIGGGGDNGAGFVWGNTAGGDFATIPGGRDNTAAGDYSFAIGHGANSAHSGAMLFADDQGTDAGNGDAIQFNSEAANEFAARAAGGVRFVTGVDGSGNPTAGVKLAAGDSVWTTLAGDTLGAGDDLGNHIATQNINLSGNYLSGDGDAEGIFVDTDGKVGIGLTAPSSKLVVRDASRAALSIKADVNTDFTGLAFENSGSSYSWTIHRAPNPSAAADLVFAGGNTSSDPAALTERMRIVKNGDVGIGTDIPASKLDVNGTVTATAFVGDGSGLTSVSGDDLGNHRATQNIRLGGNEGIYIANNGDVGFGTNSPGSSLEIFDNASSGTMLHLNNQVNVGATVIQNIGPYLEVSGGTIADAARSAIGLAVDISGINGDSVFAAIFEGGDVGIGLDAPKSRLHVQANADGFEAFVARIENTANSNGSRDEGLLIRAGHDVHNGAQESSFIQFETPAGNYCGRIRQSGNTGVEYVTASDRRLKENIQPTRFGLNDLLKIDVRDYNFKNDDPANVQTGFIAQQLHTAYSPAVGVGGDNVQTDPWDVAYGSLTPLLVQAVQDQQKIIDSQQQEIEALRKQVSEINTLKEQMARFEAALQKLNAGDAQSEMASKR